MPLLHMSEFENVVPLAEAPGRNDLYQGQLSDNGTSTTCVLKGFSGATEQGLRRFNPGLLQQL